MDEHKTVLKGAEEYRDRAFKLWNISEKKITFNEYFAYFQQQINSKAENRTPIVIPKREEQIAVSKKPKKRHYTDNSKHKAQNQKYYKFMREIALERDERKCAECGYSQQNVVHHIIKRADGGTDDINNLITLCPICHANKHKGEAVYNLMIKRIEQSKKIG